MKRLGMIGVGAMGRDHIRTVAAHPDWTVAAVSDPTEAGRAYAESAGLPYHRDHVALIEAVRPDAVMIVTPNATHVPIAIDALERGVPVLVEKPVSDTIDEAARLVAVAARTGVPTLVGHHRRHNPIVRAARRMVQEGCLGRPVCATVMATWLKPDAYFDAAWRRQEGGGPLLINLIHDIDLMRHLLGDIAEVQAMSSNAVRGFEVEDTAAVVARFASGAIASFTVSDAAVAPWNWDLAAGEAAHYPQQDVNSHLLSGTEGSLTLPRLDHWHYKGARGWHEILTQERAAIHAGNPYAEQLRHLAALIDGREAPVCSVEDAAKTLAAVLAVKESARMRTPVQPAL